MKTNIFLLLLIPVAIVVAASILNTQTPIPIQNSDMFSTGIGYHSAVCKTVTRTDGTVEDLGCKPNLFQNLGKNITRDRLSAAVGTKVDVISIANYTGAAAAGGQGPTNTSLAGDYSHSSNVCGLSNGTGSLVADALPTVSGNWSISKVFTSTCNDVIVNATALFNSTTAGAMFAQANFTSVTLQSADQINVTWYIWVT